MRAVIQRVKNASVSVDGLISGQIEQGILIYLGVEAGDNENDLSYIIKKSLGLRIFSDADGKMNLSVTDIKGGVLLVSQFTLLGDVRKGTRPSFTASAPPSEAEALYNEAKARFSSLASSFGAGVFGADMAVESLNDGPVTVLLDSRKLF